MTDRDRQRPLPGRRRAGGDRLLHRAPRVHLSRRAAPAFADVQRGNLRLLLAGPTSSAGRPMPDGRAPARAAGTASTCSSTTSAAEVARLRAAGVAFRNDVVKGPGGRQIVLDDPSGNPIELFQPRRLSDRDCRRPPTAATGRRDWRRSRGSGAGSAASASAARPPTSRCCASCASSAGGGWSAREFEDAIAACNLLPGPASTQLAIFCAWRVRGRPGALVGGACVHRPRPGR